MNEQMNIQMPVDIRAEQAVLGSIFIEKDVFSIVSDRLIGGEFDRETHKRVYRAMTKVAESGRPIDLVTVTAELQDSKELEAVGGVSYLSELSAAVPTTANVGYYIDRVQEMFLRREAIKTAMDLVKQATEEQNVHAFIAMAETSALKLSDKAAPQKDFQPIKQVLLSAWDDAERRYNARHTNRGITGIPSGFTDLDNMTAGFQSGDLIIVAARPSVGKTALALNVGQNVATMTGENTAIFSLEMSVLQLAQRMICAEANIDASRMRTGFFDDDDWSKMSMAVGKLAESGIFIDDTPGMTVNEIRSKCRRLKKEKTLGMVIIDYLQLIQSSKRGSNRQEEVSEISRTLKQLARELEVPVIALSQLSRGVEQRADKRPMMSDLRESGAIEQDADIVAFLYRDDYYDKESEKKNIIEIIIAKQRNGPVGTVELAFLKQFNKFVNLDRTNSTTEPAGRRKVPDMHRRA
ncbi:replicative DNA helicase [Paenibacillus whitsoniae]|uniref:Replicative DNA helicase n=1 Tax=Paenibacillus whitsoniae TaxID=2496558 RepID=A0A3S0BI14_9BACL|nr:replicative DNA helicase [Paenibacillus whitsoniae]RTE05508.1 replicative DNA helicase [Paenibacillus whitsoniae]